MEGALSVLLLVLLPAVIPQQALAGRLTKSPTTLRLDLSHREFASKYTRSQALQLALQRSGNRLKNFERSISLVAASASAPVTYRSSIATGPGSFIATIAIGTPPSNFTAIIDTGSDLVWRQCQPCISCFTQAGPIFSPSASSTYRNASCSDSFCLALPNRVACPSASSTCSYIYQYGDFSFSKGPFSYDTLTIPDTAGKPHTIAKFGFGCGNENQGNSFGGAGGVIGLGQGNVSLTSQMRIDKFSYCLQSITDQNSVSPLFLGPGAIIADPNARSTPLLKSPAMPSLYYVNLRGISVGRKLLAIPAGTFDLKFDGSGGSIIDSGTTASYLATAAYTEVLAAFQAAISAKPVSGLAVGLTLCYKSVVTVPSLTFHFQGADLVLPPANSFILIGGLYCMALGQSSGLTIIGNIQQQNFHFLFDRGAQQLTFAPAACDKL